MNVDIANWKCYFQTVIIGICLLITLRIQVVGTSIFWANHIVHTVQRAPCTAGIHLHIKDSFSYKIVFITGRHNIVQNEHILILSDY